ncbi:hypothetical protein U9M48_011250, partial [Paspalum notatum var. saurae]
MSDDGSSMIFMASMHEPDVVLDADGPVSRRLSGGEHDLLQRAVGGVAEPGRVEGGDGHALMLRVHHRPVLDAPVPAVGEHLDDVADVGDERPRQRRDGDPGAPAPDLQPRHGADLQQQREPHGVGVRRQAQHPAVRPQRARRVVVDPHGLRGGDARQLLLGGGGGVGVQQVPGHGSEERGRHPLHLHGVALQRGGEGGGAGGPEAGGPVLGRLRGEEEDVGPVQLLLLGHDERLAVALDPRGALRHRALLLQRQPEEALQVLLHVADGVVGHAVVHHLEEAPVLARGFELRGLLAGEVRVVPVQEPAEVNYGHLPRVVGGERRRSVAEVAAEDGRREVIGGARGQ